MKKALSIILAAALLVLCCGCALADARPAEYLASVYGVSFSETVTVEELNAALAAMGVEPIEAETITPVELSVAAVKVADMQKLAIAYENADAPTKAADTLASYGVTVADDAACYVACALDLGLADASADYAGTVSGDYAAAMLYRAAEMSGKGRHYIGRVSDMNILEQVRSALESFDMFSDDTLTDLGIEIVLQEATTGYNLKYVGYNANFLPEYTLQYGHSDYTHATQLIALMQSEGYDAYIQIEPKVSVYEYMIDWGEPGEPTPTYAVVEVAEGRYFAYAIEYDMKLEFDTVEQKEAFHSLIETYAKKYDDSYDADGNMVEKLIAGSWWQPLYTSTVPMQNEEFGLLIDNVIYDEDGMYAIHSFSVPENAEKVAAVVAEVAPQLSVQNVDLYTNPAFIRYITGSDHQ